VNSSPGRAVAWPTGATTALAPYATAYGTRGMENHTQVPVSIQSLVGGSDAVADQEVGPASSLNKIVRFGKRAQARFGDATREGFHGIIDTIKALWWLRIGLGGGRRLAVLDRHPRGSIVRQIGHPDTGSQTHSPTCVGHSGASFVAPWCWLSQSPSGVVKGCWRRGRQYDDRKKGEACGAHTIEAI
jgi:hypothetical protein